MSFNWRKFRLIDSLQLSTIDARDQRMNESLQLGLFLGGSKITREWAILKCVVDVIPGLPFAVAGDSVASIHVGAVHPPTSP